MEVIVTEVPGGFGTVVNEEGKELFSGAYQCPTCGKMTPIAEIKDGQLTQEKVAPPAKCGRCGSPMDVNAAVKFQDEMAEKAALPAPPAKRETIKV